MTNNPYTDEEIAAAIVLNRRLVAAEQRPRWVGLTQPLYIVVLFLISTAVTVLSVVVKVGQDNDQHNAAVTSCRSLYANAVADAQAEMFRPWLTMQTDFNQALLNMTQRTAADGRPDLSYLREAIMATNDASVAYAVALEDRNAWVSEGTPLPCPVKPDLPPGG